MMKVQICRIHGGSSLISIQEYRFAESLDEALALLDAGKRNRVIGGGMWLRLGHAGVRTAIDLSRLGLDKIEDAEGEVSIGAMASLRDVETAPCLRELFGGVLSESVKPIVGVQFRNMATVGASVYSRYGFSDLLTALLALDAAVVLHRAGEMPLDEFLRNPPEKRDILTAVHIRKDGRRAAYRSFRRSKTDFGVLNVCMSVSTEGDWRLSVGARPGRATRCPEAEALLAAGDGAGAAKAAAENLTYGSSLRGSADYRRHLAEVLTLRCWDALREDGAEARDSEPTDAGRDEA